MDANGLPLAEAIHQYLLSNMERRVTIPELSQRFEVSQTQLKVAFRRHHGISVYAYARREKMQAAAQLLLQSNLSILEVAGRVGYENASKFARAFADVMGTTPSKYRKIHKNTQRQE